MFWTESYSFEFKLVLGIMKWQCNAIKFQLKNSKLGIKYKENAYPYCYQFGSNC